MSEQKPPEKPPKKEEPKKKKKNGEEEEEEEEKDLEADEELGNILKNARNRDPQELNQEYRQKSGE
ncbi:MAG: hypothetical protein HZB99_01215 [Candidatus Harrisonbacteria bacterium]|nr:hypothetical protein [Candidatus Harrisonbacteria bacterium]